MDDDYSFLEVIGAFLYIVVIIGLAGFIFGLPTMWLWNSLMPAIFGLPEIKFGQAVGLIIFSRLFFGSINIDSN